MAFAFELDESNQYLRANLTGEASLKDLVSVMDAMSDGDKFRNPLRLWDLRSCDLEISAEDLRRLAEIGKARDTSAGKGALLVGRDLTYGLSRIHKVFRESEDHLVRVFREEADAISWLTGHDTNDA